MQYEVDFDTLLSLCEGKIPAKTDGRPGKVKGAFNGGRYVGAPGKDIFFALSKLTDEQLQILADKHSVQYPRKPPGNHVGTAACIRYVYGQWEKQGILRSKGDRKRMEKEDTDWSLPRKFIGLLCESFRETKHYYGLCIVAEMEGHRLGDEAILHKDDDKLKEMEEVYVSSVKYAHKCRSYKQMWTPYYWAARYFMLARDNEKSEHYCKVTIKEAEKHCPDARGSYVEKLFNCADYLRRRDKKSWEKWRNKIAPRAKNKAVKKLFRKI